MTTNNTTTKFNSLLMMALLFLANFAYAGNSSQNIAINEVFYQGNASQDWAELINRGNQAIDISGWRWCAEFVYPAITAGDILSGNADLVIEPGEIIALAVNIDLDNIASDFGLYTSSPFSNPANMVDFIQWGTSADVGRSDVAVLKGIWLELSPTIFDFIATATNSNTVNWCGTETGGGFLTTSTDFVNTAATQGIANNILSCDPIFIDGFD
jgi:hypothetical protein